MSASRMGDTVSGVENYLESFRAVQMYNPAAKYQVFFIYVNKNTEDGLCREAETSVSITFMLVKFIEQMTDIRTL